MELNKILRNIFLYGFILITFVLSGIIVNIIQCVLFVTLRQINKNLYRKINYFICYSYYSQMMFVTEWYSNSEIYVYVDHDEYKKYFGKEHAYIIMNHQYEIDWLFIGSVSEKVGCAGNFKAIAKKIVQYIPAIGWCLYFAENLFLERSFEKDKDYIFKQISELGTFQDPVWGTRFTKEKLAAQQILIKEKGLPKLKHHLIPKPKGFITSLPALRNKFGAIYDVTFSVNTKNVYPSLLNVLLGKKIVGHLYIKRIPMDKVPEDEKKATEFLNEIFIKKDQLVDNFLNTGNFFQDEEKNYLPIKLQKSIPVAINTIFWYAFIFISIFFSNFSNLALYLGFLIILILLVKKMFSLF